uniref:Uncharacterized protein n=1 Tax=Balaenoptera musculus TaxID=9771 RepID=A0A8C0E6K8_BALMU
LPALGGKGEGRTEETLFEVQGRRGETNKQTKPRNAQTVLYTRPWQNRKRKGGDCEISFLLWWGLVLGVSF